MNKEGGTGIEVCTGTGCAGDRGSIENLTRYEVKPEEATWRSLN